MSDPERSLIISPVSEKQFEHCFPTMAQGMQRALEIFQAIRSFEDIETQILRGQGLSPNTYRSYLTAYRQLWDFTNGLHPFQILPGHIERFYEFTVKRIGRTTAAQRIKGLKKFFNCIKALVPGYVSPFELMPEKLIQKMGKAKASGTKKALTVAEYIRLLAWLSKDVTIEGLSNHAIVLMLGTSGLRASELCGLRWGDLDCAEGTWSARFTGKGDKPAVQELYAPAVEAVRALIVALYHRGPVPEDALFHSRMPYDKEPRPMQYATLWGRIREIGRKAAEAGIVTRDLQWSPHLFRRSYATLLYKSGMGIKAIQIKTRHSSVETLLKHYVDDSEPATGYIDRALN
jgi:integrase